MTPTLRTLLAGAVLAGAMATTQLPVGAAPNPANCSGPESKAQEPADQELDLDTPGDVIMDQFTAAPTSGGVQGEVVLWVNDDAPTGEGSCTKITYIVHATRLNADGTGLGEPVGPWVSQSITGYGPHELVFAGPELLLDGLGGEWLPSGSPTNFCVGFWAEAVNGRDPSLRLSAVGSETLYNVDCTDTGNSGGLRR